MKKVPCIEVGHSQQLTETPADGVHAIVQYCAADPLNSFIRNPLPWLCRSFCFRNGVDVWGHTGCNPGRMIEELNVIKVYLIGLSADQKTDLLDQVAAWRIELVLDTGASSLEKNEAVAG